MAEEDPRSPLYLLRSLYAELVARRPAIDRAERYYDGEHNLAFASEKFLEAFGGLFGAFADNWCAVVVDAVEERIGVQGFRVNEGVKADGDAKRIWEDNELDLQVPMGVLDGLITGAFYVTTWYDDDGTRPLMTVESARSTVVRCHPKIRSRRTAALRCWLDDCGYEHAELFLPDRVYAYVSRSTRTSGMPAGPRSTWDADESTYPGKLDASGSMPNPLGVVPIVEVQNRPRLTARQGRFGWGRHSELASIMPLQDAVNKLLADMLVASEFAAYPQRHLTGYEPDDEIGPDGKPTGAPKPPDFKSGPGRLWWLEEENAKFGQFDAADLSSSVNSIELVVQHIASISATPPHYLRASADRLSGESIKAAETGLVAKVRRKLRVLGAGLEEPMRLAGKIAGIDALANAKSMETIWQDPESRTESEHVDALGKKKALNVPDQQLWEEAGYTPEQIARFPAMRAQGQLETMAAAAGDRARLATQERDALRARMLEETGTLPTPAT